MPGWINKHFFAFLSATIFSLVGLIIADTLFDAIRSFEGGMLFGAGFVVGYAAALKHWK